MQLFPCCQTPQKVSNAFLGTLYNDCRSIGLDVILLDASVKSENLLRENDARVFAITIASENISEHVILTAMFGDSDSINKDKQEDLR